MKRQLEHYTQREMANRIQDPDTNTADMTSVPIVARPKACSSP